MMGWARRWRQASVNWPQELDFVGPRVRTSVWGWALLVVGVSLALHASDRMQAMGAEREAAQAQLKRLERQAHAQQIQVQAEQRGLPTAVAGAESAPQAPVLTGEAWRRAAQLALWLGYDWVAELDQVEQVSAEAHVVLTGWSMDLSPLGGATEAQPERVLQAAVQDDVSALAWLAQLGDAAQLRSRERLAAPFQTAWGTYAWRVTAVTPGGTP